MHETIVPRPEPEKMNAMGAMKIEVRPWEDDRVEQ
jgi:hypothetical protein